MPTFGVVTLGWMTRSGRRSERLITLGATRVDWDGYEDDSDFVVLAGTEGNRFCVVDLSFPR